MGSPKSTCLKNTTSPPNPIYRKLIYDHQQLKNATPLKITCTNSSKFATSPNYVRCGDLK